MFSAAAEGGIKIEEDIEDANDIRRRRFFAQAGLHQLKIRTFVGFDGMVHQPSALVLDGHALTVSGGG